MQQPHMALSVDAFSRAVLAAAAPQPLRNTPTPIAPAWSPAEVRVLANGGAAPALIGVVNLAAVRTVTELRPLLAAELSESALPKRYSFVLPNGIEVNPRQEEAWPSEALRAGGVLLRPASGDDLGNDAAGRGHVMPPSSAAPAHVVAPSIDMARATAAPVQHLGHVVAAMAATEVSSTAAQTVHVEFSEVVSEGESQGAARLACERQARLCELETHMCDPFADLEAQISALELAVLGESGHRKGTAVSDEADSCAPHAPTAAQQLTSATAALRELADDLGARREVADAASVSFGTMADATMVCSFARQQASEALDAILRDGDREPPVLSAPVHSLPTVAHTHFEALWRDSAWKPALFEGEAVAAKCEVMLSAWTLQAMLDYEYLRGGSEAAAVHAVAAARFGPWRITRVLDAHGDRGLVLRACRASADALQERAVMLLPKPSASRAGDKLTRAEVRSLERATLLSTLSSPSIVSVDGSYGVLADLRLGWRFMEDLGDHVVTMEHALKAQAAAAQAAAVAGGLAPTSVPADEVAKRCYRAVKEGLRLLDALKPLHAKRLVHAALAPRHVALVHHTHGAVGGAVGVGAAEAFDGDAEAEEVLSSEGCRDANYKLLGIGSLHQVRVRSVDGHVQPERSHARLPAGVVEYASPEMRIEGVLVDERADLYSIGMILFAFVAGQPPRIDLEQPNAPDLMEEVEAGIDTHLADVLRKALHPLPALRYKDIATMEAALMECAQQQGDTWYHVFLSYRVFSDAPLVRAVYDQLRSRRLAHLGGSHLRVYLDRECIKPGRPWRQQFIDGLTHSLVFAPVVSRGALLNMASTPGARGPLAARGGAALRSEEYAFSNRLNVSDQNESSADNVLLEWQLAHALHATSGSRYGLACQRIVPLLRGEPIVRRMGQRDVDHGPPLPIGPGSGSPSGAGGDEAAEYTAGYAPLSDQLLLGTRSSDGVAPPVGMRRSAAQLHDDDGHFSAEEVASHGVILRGLLSGTSADGAQNAEDGNLVDVASRMSPALAVRSRHAWPPRPCFASIRPPVRIGMQTPLRRFECSSRLSGQSTCRRINRPSSGRLMQPISSHSHGSSTAEMPSALARKGLLVCMPIRGRKTCACRVPWPPPPRIVSSARA